MLWFSTSLADSEMNVCQESVRLTDKVLNGFVVSGFQCMNKLRFREVYVNASQVESGSSVLKIRSNLCCNVCVGLSFCTVV